MGIELGRCHDGRFGCRRHHRPHDAADHRCAGRGRIFRPPVTTTGSTARPARRPTVAGSRRRCCSLSIPRGRRPRCASVSWRPPSTSPTRRLGRLGQIHRLRHGERGASGPGALPVPGWAKVGRSATGARRNVLLGSRADGPHRRRDDVYQRRHRQPGDAASGLEDWRVVLDGAQSLFTNFNLPQGNVERMRNNAPPRFQVGGTPMATSSTSTIPWSKRTRPTTGTHTSGYGSPPRSR